MNIGKLTVKPKHEIPDSYPLLLRLVVDYWVSPCPQQSNNLSGNTIARANKNIGYCVYDFIHKIQTRHVYIHVCSLNSEGQMASSKPYVIGEKDE